MLLLVTGSSTHPVDFLHIGHGCNLPVNRRRLQRYYNRAVHETKIGFYRRVSSDMVTAEAITTRDMQDCWAEGVCVMDFVGEFSLRFMSSISIR